MNFTLDELIDRIKYHGHQYGLTTLEILEGIARQVEDEKIQLETDHEKEINEQVEQAIDDIKQKLLEKLEGLFENRTFELDDESQKEVIKQYNEDLQDIVRDIF